MQYILVNETKKEMITFTHLNGSKPRELAGNPAQSAIVTWYLLNNAGDSIQFVSDTCNDWPFVAGNKSDLVNYNDKTDELISALCKENILKDFGKNYIDEDEPGIFIRDLRNIWAT